VYFEWLSLKDFRNYALVELVLAPEGITLVEGANGAGKTNLLEAVGYLATSRSFRGVPSEGMVRSGADQAIIRAQAVRNERVLLIEAELNRSGRDNVRVNRRSRTRSHDRDLSVGATIFSPDDLELIKGGPQARRDYLDDLLGMLAPKHASTRGEFERALRQRNALLKTANGVLRGTMAGTLDIWDTKLAVSGEAVASARALLVESLLPDVKLAYETLCRSAQPRARSDVHLEYKRSWEGQLLAALQAAREADLWRAMTTVGPQRDELSIVLGGLPARTHASQGEQRSLSLALRLGGHRLLSRELGSGPVLLLDDVFSELDAGRCSALAASLPAGQALLTAAGNLPADLAFVERVRVHNGTIER
jgi:DNA replication and repair protein RecF